MTKRSVEIPRFAVVGRVNKGKSSVIASLIENDAVKISPGPVRRPNVSAMTSRSTIESCSPSSIHLDLKMRRGRFTGSSSGRSPPLIGSNAYASSLTRLRAARTSWKSGACFDPFWMARRSST